MTISHIKLTIVFYGKFTHFLQCRTLGLQTKEITQGVENTPPPPPHTYSVTENPNPNRIKLILTLQSSMD